MIIAIAMFLLLLDFGYYYYFVIVFVLAIGNTLISGSDVAFLKSLSTNFKKDYANFSSIQDLVLFVVSLLGGWIISFSFNIPIIVSLISFILATILALSISSKGSKSQNGNIFSSAYEGIKFILSRKQIIVLVIFLVAIYGFGRNVKTILATVPEITDISLSFVGVMVGLGMLSRSIGKKFSYKINFSLTFLVLSLFLSLLTSTIIISEIFIPMGIIIGNFFIGVIKTKIDIKINNLVIDQFRAGILSLNNLLTQLFSSVYLFYAGYILEFFNYNFLIFSTIFIFSFVLILYLIMYKYFQKSSPIKDW